MSQPTVRIDIAIMIEEQGVVDTEIPVAEWNAMTDDERHAVARRMWNAMAEQDNGGMRVVTPGAEGT